MYRSSSKVATTLIVVSLILSIWSPGCQRYVNFKLSAQFATIAENLDLDELAMCKYWLMSWDIIKWYAIKTKNFLYSFRIVPKAGAMKSRSIQILIVEYERVCVNELVRDNGSKYFRFIPVCLV